MIRDISGEHRLDAEQLFEHYHLAELIQASPKNQDCSSDPKQILADIRRVFMYGELLTTRELLHGHYIPIGSCSYTGELIHRANPKQRRQYVYTSNGIVSLAIPGANYKYIGCGKNCCTKDYERCSYSPIPYDLMEGIDCAIACAAFGCARACEAARDKGGN